MYVWEDVLVDYSGGLACIYAESIEQALEYIKMRSNLKDDYDNFEWNSLYHEIISDGKLIKEPKVIETLGGVVVYGGG